MSVISVLDKYISGDFIGGNDMLSKDYIDNIMDSEESEINSLLFDFRQKNLNFFVMDTGGAGRLPDAGAQLRVVADSLLQPKGDVLLQGIREQEIVLRHIGHVPVKHGQREIRNRPAIYKQRPFPAVVDPQEQVRQAGLSAARPAQDAQHLPCLHMKAHILQHRRLPVRIGEGQVL